MEAKLTRYLVRTDTKEVFIWTEALAKGYPELKEVLARDAEEALQKKALPDPRRISMMELESMSKKELIEFAAVRLELELDAAKKLGVLQNEVKVAIFTKTESDPEADIPEQTVDMRTGEAAKNETRPMPNRAAARKQAGL